MRILPAVHSGLLRPVLLAVVLLVPSVLAGAGSAPAAEPDPDAAPEAVAEAIRQARAGQPFHLVVHCTDEEGLRSVELFPGGVAIWNGRSQVQLGDETRSALLDTLLAGGFPSLARSYGGKRPAPPEPPAGPEAADAAPPAGETGAPAPKAPLRVRCRLTFESGGVSKTSIQQAQGEQSPELTGLADALLDRVAPIAAERAVTADNLADGLAKLAAGALAPETFRLRLVRLPAEASGAGSIVHLAGSALTQRPYAIGRELGAPVTSEIDGEALATLAERLRAADLPSLPANLWAADHLELEVQVLGHTEAVIARPFRGLSREEKGAEQKRFDELASFLRQHYLPGA